MSKNIKQQLSNIGELIPYLRDDGCGLRYDLQSRDIIVNKFRNFTEIVFYKKPFGVNVKSDNEQRSKKLDISGRDRNWRIENGDLIPLNDEVTYNDLFASKRRSRKNALDKFWGYALSNQWNYFVTLTFDPKKIDRSKDDDVKYAFKLFRQKLQYHYPNVSMLFVSEEHHTDGCLHFHGLLGNADISNHLMRAVNNMKYLNTYDFSNKKKIYKYDNDGKKILNKYYKQSMYTKQGDPIYNFKKTLYDLGLNSVVKLQSENESCSNDKICSYLTKYITKDINIYAYNKRAYFRTNNLRKKEKIVSKSVDEQGRILSILYNPNLEIRKENDKIIVFVLKNKG